MNFSHWGKNRGYFWGDRFKSVIVDRGETLVNCLAYIDLNPLRAGMVSHQEQESSQAGQGPFRDVFPKTV
jgi:hypothetical protein